MAERIRLWGVAICSAAVIAGLITALAPSGAVGRTLKYLVGIFLTAVIIGPFIGFEADFKAVSSANNSAGYAYEANQDALILETESIISKKIDACLINEGISDGDVYIKINENESGGLEFQEIRITLSAEFFDRREAIKKSVLQLTGTAPDIIFMR